MNGHSHYTCYVNHTCEIGILEQGALLIASFNL